MAITAPNMYSVQPIDQYELYSLIPIVECTGIVKKYEHSREKYMVHYCATEKLYYFMTGVKDIKIVTKGINNA